MSNNRCLIGPHASISKGILNAIKYAEYIDGNTLQIFLGSNQTTSLKMKTKITEEQIKEVREHLQKTKTVLVIHTVYLLNFCTHPPTHSGFKYARDNLVYDIRLTQKLGGIGCVLHIGYQKDLEEKEAYKNMVDNVKFAIDETKDCPDVKIILETPAGQGSQIGINVADFARIWNAFPKSYYKRLGTCVDTAHIFSAGHDISTIEGMKAYFKEYDKLIGLKNLSLFHINDSKVPCNSRKDKHEGLGDGYIFDKEKGGDLLALKEIWKISTKHNIPMVLETHGGGYFKAPKDMGKYAQEIELFRSWDKNKSIHKNFKLVEKIIEAPKNAKHKTTTRKTTTRKTPKKGSNKKRSKKEETLSNLNFKKYKINTKIVDIFKELSYYYNIEKNSIRKSAYDKAVYQLRRFPNKIEKGLDLKDVPGIGKKMIEKIDEIIETNQLETLNKLKKLYDVAKDSIEHKENLQNVLGFGDSKIKQLEDKFSITTVSELYNYIKKHNNINDLGLTNQQKVGIKYHKELSKKVARDEAEKITESVKKVISSSSKPLIKKASLSIELAGSFASSLTKESKDIDILIRSSKFKEKEEIESTTLMRDIVIELMDAGLITDNITLGSNKFLGVIQLNSKTKHRHLDMRLVNSESYIYAKLYYTSGAIFNKMMRSQAKKQKLKLNEWGLYDSNNRLVPGIKTEKDIFEKIKMSYVVLEDRR